MAEMKDSGIEWIGEIPDDWKIFHFKYIVKEKIDNRGRTPEIDENDIGIPIIELDAIGNKNPDVEKASKFISEESYKKYIRKGLKSGDVLFGTVGSVGKCSIVPNEFNYCIAQNIVGYRFNNEQDSLFWYYYFKSEPFKHMYMQFNKGNIQNSIKISDMERGVLVIPPLKEQQFIANFLDKKCAEIDSLYTDIEKQIEILEEYKKSIITEAVTKGLDPDAEMKDSGIEWIGKIPKNWKTNKIKYLFTSGKGLSITKENLIDEGLPVISYGQIHAKTNSGVDINKDLLQFVSYEYQKRNPNCEVKKFDFIFADTSEDYEGCGNGVYKRDNSILFAGYHSIILRAINQKDNRYLAYLFLTDLWRKQIRETASGVKVFSVTQKNLINSSIILPPEDEQNEIANYLDVKCNKIDSIIVDKKKQLETLEQYKKSLIYEYVTGKKEVLND